MAKSAHSHSHSDGHGQHGGGSHHIIPFSTYMKVFWTLIGLTVLTVLLATRIGVVNLGAFAPIVAFGIATLKAILVMAIFMHLKYDDRLNTVIIASSFFFLFLLWMFSVVDIYTRYFVGSTL
jgi:caa(3)-type oxidase subunit IV